MDTALILVLLIVVAVELDACRRHLKDIFQISFYDSLGAHKKGDAKV
jgi:hypothetical protein